LENLVTLREKGTHSEKCVTLGKIAQTWKKGSRLKKWVTLKKGLHFGKWVILGKMGHS